MHPVKILSHPGSVEKQRKEFAEARSYKSRGRNEADPHPDR